MINKIITNKSALYSMDSGDYYKQFIHRFNIAKQQYINDFNSILINYKYLL